MMGQFRATSIDRTLAYLGGRPPSVCPARFDEEKIAEVVGDRPRRRQRGRWRRKSKDEPRQGGETLTPMQQMVLDTAASLARPDGTLDRRELARSLDLSVAALASHRRALSARGLWKWPNPPGKPYSRRESPSRPPAWKVAEHRRYLESMGWA
jgi:hypothetical protein